MLFKIPENITF